jgi:hypothetical protein
VRQYRASLAAPDLPGFGFTFDGAGRHASSCALIAGALPLVRLTIAAGIEAELVTFAPNEDAPAAGR